MAKENHAVLAEAMTIYHMPLYREPRQRVDSGAWGRVNLIQLNFGSFKVYDMKNRFFNPNLAGGAMPDIGVYESAAISMMNREGQLVTAMLSLHSKQPKRAVILFEKGYAEILEYPRAEQAVFVDAETGAVETIRAGRTADALRYELEDMEAAVTAGGDMVFPYTMDVMRLMTSLRRDWGVVYPEEEPKLFASDCF